MYVHRKYPLRLLYPAISVCCLFLLVNAGPVFAQSSGFAIEGYLYDRESRKPVTDANIYLSETTLGDASDGEGYFRITDVPAGNYQLVISHTGYETSSRSIKVAENEDLFLEQLLTRSGYKLNSVVVVSRRDRSWERNLKRFEQYFIGETDNGKRTEIRNPEVLNFEITGDVLFAEAVEELNIVNRALGYEIILELTHFEWNYISNTGQTLYFCRFHELEPAGDAERKAWEANRRRTYKYSPERFLKSLITGRHKSEYRISGGKIYSMASEAKESYRLFDETNTIHRFKVSIFLPNHNTVVRIDDPNVYGDEEYGYIGYNDFGDEREDIMYVDQNGNLMNPLDFTLDGIWFDYRLADKLPLDYRYEHQ